MCHPSLLIELDDAAGRLKGINVSDKQEGRERIADSHGRMGGSK